MTLYCLNKLLVCSVIAYNRDCCLNIEETVFSDVVLVFVIHRLQPFGVAHINRLDGTNFHF